jgi:hypothetical protein
MKRNKTNKIRNKQTKEIEGKSKKEINKNN